MPTIRLTVSGPPGTINANLSAIITAITGSGATLYGEIGIDGDGSVTSDPTTLTGLTIVFRGRIIFHLQATRAIADALVTALGPVKTGAPSLRFGLVYEEPVSL
jgi:hypothetical protein